MVNGLKKASEHPLFEEMVMRLENWAEHISGYRARLGHPTKVSLLSNGGRSKSIDDMMDESDYRINQTVNGCVESLEPAQEAAIMTKYTGASWRFPRPGYTFDDALEDAHNRLLVLMHNRDVIGLLKGKS